MIESLKQFFLKISPFIFYSVSGRSMYPSFIHGQIVLAQKKWFFCFYRKGDVIIFTDPIKHLRIIKRIQKIKKESLYLIGDNKKESTDSRNFGWIDKKYTIGKVIFS